LVSNAVECHAKVIVFNLSLRQNPPATHKNVNKPQMRKKFTQDKLDSADNLTMLLMLNGEPMLYLGPIETRQRLQELASSRPKATTAITAYAKEVRGSTVFVTHEQDSEEAVLELPPNGVERRVSPDRRAKKDTSLVDTRASKDRRKSYRAIHISI
jgi:hypothetical protein